MRASYHDIKADVLSRIRTSIWPPGSNLPGEIELAKEFGCARATVNRAMRELVEEGIVERKRKAGTRVRASHARSARFEIPFIRDEINKTGADYRYSLVERQVRTAPGWLRAKLGLTNGGQVLELACMHYATEKPYQFERRWINLAAGPAAAAEDQSFEAISPNEWLLENVPYSDAEIAFGAVKADSEVAGFLDLAAGDAIFAVDRTTWLDGQNVAHARLFYAAGYRMTSQY